MGSNVLLLSRQVANTFPSSPFSPLPPLPFMQAFPVSAHKSGDDLSWLNKREQWALLGIWDMDSSFFYCGKQTHWVETAVALGNRTCSSIYGGLKMY